MVKFTRRNECKMKQVDGCKLFIYFISIYFRRFKKDVPVKFSTISFGIVNCWGVDRSFICFEDYNY